MLKGCPGSRSDDNDSKDRDSLNLNLCLSLKLARRMRRESANLIGARSAGCNKSDGMDSLRLRGVQL